MQHSRHSFRWWLLGGALLGAIGAIFIARQFLDEQKALFETDARIVHRLLSQRVVQHDAILATLTLLQPAAEAPGATPPEQRLPALYPHILAVQRRDRDGAWSDPALAAAEAASRQSGQAALASVDFASGRYQLVLASTPTSYALTVDLRAMVPWDEWPMLPEASPVRVWLEHGGQLFQIQAGHVPPETAASGWRFDFHKHLAAESQPFDVVAERHLGWLQLPWWRMLAWVLAVAAVLAVMAQAQRQRSARRRAEELLRLGQVARLNTLGELAAGMAHELNQPLTAVLANTQGALRLISEEPPELDTAREAMRQAAAQARRAADVVGRLRQAVERPAMGGAAQAVSLNAAVQRALYLLEPESRRRGVEPVLRATEMVTVQADPVALEQIVHNLLMNALQALEQVDAGRRQLEVSLVPGAGVGVLEVVDSGPGIAPEALPRLFEPFFSTREGGLGLGLSLCETLASGMGGSLTARNGPQGGAVFTLTLPQPGVPA
jgi:signal transduction histidine kinase